MMFGYYGHLGAWGWFGMTVGMVAFWVLVFAAIYWLVRSFARRDQQDTTPRATPEQLLAERFARGEIDETDYHGRLAALHATVRR
jgi:putative membrane protein